MDNSVGIPLLLGEKEYFLCVCTRAYARVCVHVCVHVLGTCMGCVYVCVCVCMPVSASPKYLWAGRWQLGKAGV